MKINQKLALAFSLILIGFSSLLVIFNSLFIDKYYIYKTETSLYNEYQEINEYFHSSDFNPNTQNYLFRITEKSIQSNSTIIFFNSNGIRLTMEKNPSLSDTRLFMSLNDLRLEDSAGNAILDYESAISTSGTIIKFEEPQEKDTKSIGLLGRIVINDATFGYVFLYTSYTVMEENIKIFNSFIFYITLILLVLSAIIASIVSRRLTSPIKQIEEKTKKISNLDFSGGLIEYESNDEIGELTNSINKMSSELEKSINELKEANKKLEEDIKLKERVEKLKEEFISDVSHELKTPISIINGYSEALKLEGITKEDLYSYADIIIDESNRMNKLVRDLLKFTQIESGFISLDREEIKIIDLINDCVNPLKLRLDEKKIELKIEVEDKTIIGDYDMLQTVFNNYFTNAMHYTDMIIRKIKVYSEIINDKLRIYVYNSGDQISEENQNRIFESFYKIDKSRSRKYGGSGLGLSIVKSIMDAYNNKFGVKNEDDGVSFYFDLDIKKDEE